MNITRRLAKIEETLRVNNPASEFCGCQDEQYWRGVEEYYNARRDGKEAPAWAFNYSPNLETKRCDYCQKPLSLGQIKYLESLMKVYGKKHQSDHATNKNV